MRLQKAASPYSSGSDPQRACALPCSSARASCTARDQRGKSHENRQVSSSRCRRRGRAIFWTIFRGQRRHSLPRRRWIVRRRHRDAAAGTRRCVCAGGLSWSDLGARLPGMEWSSACLVQRRMGKTATALPRGGRTLGAAPRAARFRPAVAIRGPSRSVRLSWAGWAARTFPVSAGLASGKGSQRRQQLPFARPGLLDCGQLDVSVAADLFR